MRFSSMIPNSCSISCPCLSVTLTVISCVLSLCVILRGALGRRKKFSLLNLTVLYLVSAAGCLTPEYLESMRLRNFDLPYRPVMLKVELAWMVLELAMVFPSDREPSNTGPWVHE